MEKCKTSEIFNELLSISQASLAVEDKHLVEKLKDVFRTTDIPDYETILKIIQANNEYLRMSMIRTVIAVLVKHGFLENDLNSSRVTF